MPERKTVGQLMEEMRLKAGAQNYHGHEYMDLERFAEDTRHMIIQGSTGRETLKSSGSMTVSRRGNTGQGERRRPPPHSPHSKTE